MERRKRKNIRLEKYDYGRPGSYFVTICTKERHHFLWDPRGLSELCVGAACGRPRLSNIGQVVDREIQKLNEIYPAIKVNKYVIMPNHVHLLLCILSSDGGRPQAAPTLPRIVNQFKGSVTKAVGYSVWQKSYHDHIIRNDADYLRIWQYIDTNPEKWREDCYYKEGLY
jgi:REP element-mobilizing transposase RayT